MDTTYLIKLFNDNRGNIKLGGYVLFIAMVVGGYLQNFLINLPIFVYLVSRTIMSINFNNKSDMSDTQKSHAQYTEFMTLLKYWSTFSSVIIAESFLNIFLIFSWLTFTYNLLKLGMFTLMLQSDVRILLVYDLVLVQLYRTYQEQINYVVSMMERKAREYKPPAGYSNKSFFMNWYERFFGKSHSATPMPETIMPESAEHTNVSTVVKKTE